MDILLRKRTQLRREFTLLEKAFSAAVETHDILEGKFTALTDAAEALRDIESQVCDAFCASDNFDEQEFGADQDKALDYKQRWAEAKATYNKSTQQVQVASRHNSRTSLNTEFNTGHSNLNINLNRKKSVKMPRLELPKFDGDVKNWIQFWGQFSKIHEDIDTDNIDKFQYLIQSTTVNSPARQLVASYPPSAENYPKAIEALKARFARDEMLIETYVRGLLSLVWSQLKGNVCSLPNLYDNLQTHLQALETLNITKDKFASVLYPMIESALPEDLLRSWNRIRAKHEYPQEEIDDELSKLMSFLKAEVESEERISLARQGFSQPASFSPGAVSPTVCFVAENKKNVVKSSIVASLSVQCLWCDKDTHTGVECHKATRMTPRERLELVKTKKACLICLKTTHNAKKCKYFPKCLFCMKRHVTLLCQNLPEEKDLSKPDSMSSNGLLSQNKSTTLLQTIAVKLISGNKEIRVRALIDGGAQRSYITNDLVNKLEQKPARIEEHTHGLFGGIETNTAEYPVYDVCLKSVCNNFSMNISVLGQENICGVLPKVRSDVLIEQLRLKGITLTDSTAITDDVKMLIGADFSGMLMTGNLLQLENNLTAVQTKMGWTIQGHITGVYTSTTVNLHCSFKPKLSDLWDLEVLGIRDPSEQISKQSREKELLEHFKQTISVNEENRYEVCLPWRDNMPRPESNYEVVEKRLLSTTKRLESLGKTDAYDAAFKEWMTLGIIEKAPCQNINFGHFVPHHPVIKESSATTKIRPVFDAAAKDCNGISLNSCLEKGANLIELIPKLLIDFRKEAIGVTADIAKAFLQISLVPEDREYLKFLWWSDVKKAVKTIAIYRHKRVTFGVTSSPFHLAATIAYHLDHAPDHLKETAIKLKNSYYVDNCVTSVSSVDDLEKFVREAKELMLNAMFDLRCWVTAPVKSDETASSSILGIVWNVNSDELSCNVNSICGDRGTISKRSLLSVVHKVFDPIGILCPSTIVPKMILQKTWAEKLSWDDELPTVLFNEFMAWARDLHLIRQISIPRRLTRHDISICQNSLHVFCDASLMAYATCIFLRSELQGDVCIRLVMAKARVTPTKKITIPRLELIAATLSTRLTTTVVDALKLSNCPVYYWTDSSVVLAWIKGDGPWSVFVSNRVKEIRASSTMNAWRHVPGHLNPADLPSRGVDLKTLLEIKWWDGPSWLIDQKTWPISDIIIDGDMIDEERRRTPIRVMVVEEETFLYRLAYFSGYTKIVRMIGWMLRFKYKAPSTLPHTNLGYEEIERAQTALFRLIQCKHSHQLSNLQTFSDDNGILRLKTRLTHMNESYDFRHPVVLSARNTIVQRLVAERHRVLQHAGTQTLMVNLREEFWIVGVRKLAKKTVKECIICKRFKAKPLQTPPASLPKDRTEASVPFQATGVDLAGPLLLKSQSKCWIVLFTCATYRAIHLEVVESLSSADFILALRRFISRRGRVKDLYSDNGTNFVGVHNLISALDWDKIISFSNFRKIQWHFSPPSAPWWGRFFERLVGVVKQMLVRVLGRAAVSFNELQTVLCDCEATINSRPLTYFSNSSDEPRPLTPAMFIQPLTEIYVGDLDYIDGTSLIRRARYCQSLRDNFRQRFRSEYLSNLIQRVTKGNAGISLKSGDIVLIESDCKRLMWPLGVVEETYVGQDGHERVAKVRTASGHKVRPFQRLYPLELYQRSDDDDVTFRDRDDVTALDFDNLRPPDIDISTRTRAGRISKPPLRFAFD